MTLQNKSNGIYLNVQGLKVPYGWWYSIEDDHVEILGPGILTRKMGHKNCIAYWGIPDAGVFGPMPIYYRDRVRKPQATYDLYLIGDSSL